MKAKHNLSQLTLSQVRQADTAELLSAERAALEKLRQKKRAAEGWLGFGTAAFLLLFVGAPFIAFEFMQYTLFAIAFMLDALGSGLLVLIAIIFSILTFLLAAAALATVGLTHIDVLRQSIEDRLARITFIEIANGKARRFALYLRAFDTTGQIRRGHRHTFAHRFGAVLKYFLGEMWTTLTRSKKDTSEQYAQLFVGRRNHAEIEAAISYDLRTEMPFLALGKVDGKDGAGKLTTSDEEWKSTVEILIANAERIFCVPDDNAGTLWELSQLRSANAIERTIFIMPSAKMMPERSDTYPLEWQAMAALAKPHGLHFPTYNPDGVFFALDADGNVDYSISFSLGSPGTFSHIHDELIRVRRPAEERERESRDRRVRRRRG